MEPRSKPAVSTYLEVFILIGVATGGSALVYSATATYSGAVSGPAVNVSDVSIRQGSSVALVQMVVADTGTTAFSSFTVTVAGGFQSSPSYCLTLFNRATSAFVQPYTGICATPTGTTAGSITATPTDTITPGQNVLTAIVIYGNVFVVGSTYSVTVLTSSASLQQVSAVATPA